MGHMEFSASTVSIASCQHLHRIPYNKLFEKTFDTNTGDIFNFVCFWETQII